MWASVHKWYKLKSGCNSVINVWNPYLNFLIQDQSTTMINKYRELNELIIELMRLTPLEISKLKSKQIIYSNISTYSSLYSETSISAY